MYCTTYIIRTLHFFLCISEVTFAPSNQIKMLMVRRSNCRLTLMAIWTGVNPLRFSSLSAPVNSVPKREVKSGSNGVWPAEQTQCNKLLPRWSVRFRINVDSKPSVTSSCGRRRKKAMMNCAFFPCNYTHIFGRFRTAEKNHLERGTPTALLNIRLRGSTPYT